MNLLSNISKKRYFIRLNRHVNCSVRLYLRHDFWQNLKFSIFTCWQLPIIHPTAAAGEMQHHHRQAYRHPESSYQHGDKIKKMCVYSQKLYNNNIKKIYFPLSLLQIESILSFHHLLVNISIAISHRSGRQEGK